jgi:hypothetical protein
MIIILHTYTPTHNQHERILRGFLLFIKKESKHKQQEEGKKRQKNYFSG